ncbi:MAG: glycosyltransferase family 2 protein [bacterium]
MKFTDFSKYKVGRADELKGTDRMIYRALEMLPGLLSWGTILGAIIASYFIPLYAAIFIIAFDLYWFLKTIYLSLHLRHNWKRTLYNMNLNWVEMLNNLKYEHIYHMVILPFYKEDTDVLETAISSLIKAKVNRKKVMVVLAAEERAGLEAKERAESLMRKYAPQFGHFIITIHPKDQPGELAGKGSNISYACEEARKRVLDAQKINYKDVIVSAFDIDTIVYPQYFSCLTWNFLTHPNPYRTSFQPVPFYNNNIWKAPALSRVVAFSGTFWQMIQQERPERLATFSSHAVSFQTLYEVGYWQKNMVSEDSRIFWNCYLAFDGNYDVVPMSYPVSMDAALAPKFWQTLKNVYKQQRRWTWGVENVPYILFGFIKHPRISLSKKLKMTFVQLEGFWSLATNPIMIFLLGWLPVVIGHGAFRASLLSYNLPIITRDIMAVTLLGLVMSAVISMSLLPKMPKGIKGIQKVWMALQWVFVPITITIFGAIPGLDAQTRLLLGKYMGFWVTPKHR